MSNQEEMGDSYVSFWSDLSPVPWLVATPITSLEPSLVDLTTAPEGRLPESMRTMEPFHELGRPDLER